LKKRVGSGKHTQKKRKSKSWGLAAFFFFFFFADNAGKSRKHKKKEQPSKGSERTNYKKRMETLTHLLAAALAAAGLLEDTRRVEQLDRRALVLDLARDHGQRRKGVPVTKTKYSHTQQARQMPRFNTGEIKNKK
jgi:hypothetical protein